LKVSIVLPSYNERGSLEKLIPALYDELAKKNYTDIEVLVVDDNSPDGTPELVRELTQAFPTIKLILRQDEKGLASAVQRGLQESTGDVVVVMDSDFNHHPEDVPRLLEHIDRYDMVVGSRYVPGGDMETSKLRYYLSYAFNLFVRFLLGLKTTDNLSGFFAMRRSAVDQLDSKSIFEGFGEFHIPLAYWATRIKKISIHEVSTVYRHRIYGESKFKYFPNLVNYTKVVLRLKLGNYSWQETPRKVEIKK